MSKTLVISVDDKVATCLSDFPIVCGNSGYEVEFQFDAEWDNHFLKTAVFTVNNKPIHAIFEGNLCKVPVVRNTLMMEVGVFAGTIDDGTLSTSTPALVECRRCATDGVNEVVPPPEDDVYAQILKEIESIRSSVGESNTSARISDIVLIADGWVGATSPYSQVVNIEGITENSQVDLTPNIEQLTIFYEKDLCFVTENEDGVVTVYALGDKPQNDYTIQVTITEVRL